MSDVRDRVFGPCQTCLRPICQCPAKHTPPPDAQAMTREQVVGICLDFFDDLPTVEQRQAIVKLRDNDAAQRETIRRLEDLLESAKENERFLRDTPWLQENASLQARLTASEAAKKWTTARPTVEGWYWWKHGGSVTPRYVHSVTQANPPILRVECPDGWFEDVDKAGGEFQGPLTPGEE